MGRKNRVVLGVIVVAAILIVLGITVAYFVTDIEDTNKEVLTVNTGSLSLIFDDNSDGVNTSLLVGESVTKELKIHNNGTLPVTTNLNWYDLTNTYLPNSLSYKLEFKDSEEGTYQVIEAEETSIPKSLKASEATILKNITIGPEETYYYRITITLESLENMNQENDRKAGLATRFMLDDYKEIKVNFAEPATTDEGLYAMEDDYGTSYYYRGAVENNYVKFGGFYWRIIRFNGDGSMRMIYDGTSYHANGESSNDRYTKTGQPFNATATDAKYVGYMYGGSNRTAASTNATDAQTNTYNSDIKTVVDTWYEKNIKVNAANGNIDLTKYLADAIFCNDRTMPAEGEIWRNDQDTTHTNLGWGSHTTPYGAYHRFVTASRSANENPVPTFKCGDNLTTGNINNDKFTVSDTELGNGALKYPIGLITADEIAAAGSGKFNISGGNSSYYLYRGTGYMWSLSSYYMANGYATGVFVVNSNGSLNSSGVFYSSGAVAPVINLKADYVKQLIGTGVKDDEYRLEDVN